jgi:hypothetical protein
VTCQGHDSWFLFKQSQFFQICEVTQASSQSFHPGKPRS